MKVALQMTVILLASVFLSACDTEKNELVEVAVIQQYSPSTDKWDNVTLFYGFGENYNMAMKMVNAFKPISERPMRVQTYKMKRGDLKSVYELKSR
jgi:hypothetical protein